MIRRFVEDDISEVTALWHRCTGPRWRLKRERFRETLMAAFEPGDHFVAEENGRIVGLAATQTREVAGEAAPRGEVMAVMVAPGCRRRGIGRALLEAAETRLAGRGVAKAQLGGGGVSYLWPGVPVSQPGAWAFFAACGWEEAERSFDLIGDLKRCRTPRLVRERIESEGVRVEPAGTVDGDAEAVTAFERRHFPAWVPHFEEMIGAGRIEDVVVARHPERGIVGTSSAVWPRDRTEAATLWTAALGEATGAVGPLGVAPEMRERGIGLALAARVTDTLRARGMERSFVGWTWLAEWYGRLGYEVWEEYAMSWKAPRPD